MLKIISGCSFDLCFNCFSGRQHQLHFHGLVAKESKNSGHRLYCSRCTRQLPCHLYYACRDPNCMFTLCSACFSTPPTPHPFHPQHILLVTDPRQAYPQSGGVWHCDNCTNNHAQHRPSPLTVNDVMYHCERCQYDLCELCYKRGFSQNHVVQTDRDSLWSNGGPCLSRQHSYFTDDTQYQRVRKARPSVTELPFMPNPLLSSSTTLPSASPPHAPTIPTRTACRSCGTAPAKFTLVHSRTVPPHKAALYCLNCAWEVKKRKDPCPLCGLTADDIEEV